MIIITTAAAALSLLHKGKRKAAVKIFSVRKQSREKKEGKESLSWPNVLAWSACTELTSQHHTPNTLCQSKGILRDVTTNWSFPWFGVSDQYHSVPVPVSAAHPYPGSSSETVLRRSASSIVPQE
jgi:hypothetical protein